MKGLKVLIIDDEPLMRLSMVDALEGVGAQVAAAATGTEGLRVIDKRDFDVVITDLRLPGSDGLAILKASKERNPNTEVILITAHGSVDTAVGAMKLGAYDYITKPFQMEELLLIVERVGKMFDLRRDSAEVKETLEDRSSFGGLLARSEAMRAVLDQVKRMAAADTTVLLIGEPGTGKELIATTIHLNSARKDRPLVKVSCSGVSDARLELEIFGHEKGAVPGAARRRRGRFELAHKGTLFLEEVAGLSASIQARLLGVLQDRRVVRVGGTEPVNVDVRLVCSTQKDLETEVQEGRFREDLYQRLAAVRITVPPLRDRRDDILLMAEAALREFGVKAKKTPKGLSPESLDLLDHYSFPSNVEELEHLIQRAVEFTRDGEAIQPWALCGSQQCPYLGGAKQEFCGFCREGLTGEADIGAVTDFVALAEAREQFERDYIEVALRRAGGDHAIAARMLGLSPQALMEKYRKSTQLSDTDHAADEAAV